ncbi:MULTISPECIES: energy-coupling factor transporter transmembrane protein EcfT [Exiguobacterium]|uniref:Energy-coupling factor transporter transmembrane protein EcfT n=1 Tax=Exiguobacterium sibiricum (strain DSM 17290 / CCUG 55495 / CIP 109462 / JCM 13490 / 255-15) TaxID=262543 RepID=ECFT_EXIS2|nr:MULTISPECIES: energy-coupling factor transporter transmembrane protein EcfT [Exiguobacterium]B1YH82.1 RecName: Full=Energy-coupling factor transporter transmembrane protein EcfT; Short=ECF transporter T component EcfT [Exiguobacterium sibiricum 255-15]ACB59614.1 cobalt transport protein [Exiguobacterium sibiricum 255-15]MCT4791145.1 energy-coupling factor transporter transmembrane protein EcfT [Exiguobacterium artemiae]
MIVGQHIPGTSYLHRSSAVAKIIFAFCFIPLVFLANNAATNIFLLLFTFFALASSKLPIRYVLKGLRPILFLIIFTFIIQLLFTREGAVLFEFGWFKIYEEGLRLAIIVSLRFFYLVSITTLVTLTTSPIELTDAIELLLKPFKVVRVPTHEIALMLSISLRFLPTLAEETEKIMKAQQARGVDLSAGPIKERLRAIIPLLIPLFISAFKRAEDLATAMEARGYRGGEGRTRLRESKWTTRDTGLILLLVALGLLLVYLRGGF